MKRKRFGILICVTALILTILAAAPPARTAFECSDETMDACQRAFSTAYNQCMAFGNSISTCWDYANQRHADCLRVNNCINN